MPVCSYSYKKLWNKILMFLGVPAGTKAGGPTPGSLRGSGATHWYIHTEDVQRIAWRGRWRSTRTLKYYLQEVAAQSILAGLPPAVRDRIAYFAEAAPSMRCHFAATGK